MRISRRLMEAFYADIYDEISILEKKWKVEKILKKLKTEERRVILLRFASGRKPVSYRIIGEMLSIPAMSACRKVRRILKKMYVISQQVIKR